MSIALTSKKNSNYVEHANLINENIQEFIDKLDVKKLETIIKNKSNIIVNSENNLEFYNQDKFAKVVWVCKIKK